VLWLGDLMVATLMIEFIHIVDYDPAWPQCYEQEAAVVLQALGDYCRGIHHVGSTSVPGLSAKPVIDMAVECGDYPPTPAMIAALAAVEYEHRGEFGVVGRHFFSKGVPRRFHLHLVPEHGEVAQRQLAFRDYLRTHPEAAQEYLAIKLLAAPGQAIGSNEYVLAKAPFVEAVLTKVLGIKFNVFITRRRVLNRHPGDASTAL